MSRVSTILNRAADELDQRGKARHRLINQQGNVCAMGALRIAAGGVPSEVFGTKTIITARMSWHAYEEAYRAFDQYMTDNGTYKNDKQKDNGIAGWNDRSNKDTVVTALREAANYLDRS